MANYIKKINGYVIKDEEARTAAANAAKAAANAAQTAANAAAAAATAQGTANTAVSKADSAAAAASAAQGTANSAQQTANQAMTEAGVAYGRAEEAYALAEGKNNALVYDTFQDAGQELYNMHHGSTAEERSLLPIGTQILIKEIDVPDYWVSGYLDTEKPFTATGGGLPNAGEERYEIGYYEISMLESDKVDLSGYAKTSMLNAEKITLKVVDEELQILKAGVKITPTT